MEPLSTDAVEPTGDPVRQRARLVRLHYAPAESRALGTLAILAILGILWIMVPVGLGVLLGTLLAFTGYARYRDLAHRTRKPALAAALVTTVAHAPGDGCGRCRHVPAHPQGSGCGVGHASVAGPRRRRRPVRGAHAADAPRHRPRARGPRRPASRRDRRHRGDARDVGHADRRRRCRGRARVLLHDDDDVLRAAQLAGPRQARRAAHAAQSTPHAPPAARGAAPGARGRSSATSGRPSSRA